MPDNERYKSFSTAGNGDCAFHAIFGDYDVNKKQFFCENVAEKRKQVAELITQQYLDINNNELIHVVNTGLFEIGDTEKEASLFPHIIKLKQHLTSEKHIKVELCKNLLEQEINNNQEFLEQINTFNQYYPPTNLIVDNNVWDKFMYFISKNSDEIILSKITEHGKQKGLLQAYSNFKQASDSLRDDSERFNLLIQDYFSKFTDAKQQVLQELADKIISKPRAWLPQHFMRAIAICSNKIIHFYIKDPKTNKLNGGTEYKGTADDATQEVRVYFDGGSHYERVVDLNWSPTNSYKPPTPSLSCHALAMQPQPTIQLPIDINKKYIEEYFNKQWGNGVSYKSATKNEFKETGIFGEIITTEPINNSDRTIQKDTTLVTFKPSSVECRVMPNSTNNNGKILLEVQQQILLDFLQLYSQKAIQEKLSSPIVIEANNFNPEDLEELLTRLIKNPIPLISLALPLHPKNVNQQAYTPQDINKINALITKCNGQVSVPKPKPK